MDCKEVRRTLATGQSSALISRHLESCAGCREELAALERLDVELNLVGDVEVRPYFMTRLRQRIADRAQSGRSRWLRRTLIPLGAAAVCLLASITGLRIGRAVSARQVANVVTQTGLDLLDDSSTGSMATVSDVVFSGGDDE